MDYSYWLALSNAEYLSYREKFILVEKFKDAKEIFSAKYNRQNLSISINEQKINRLMNSTVDFSIQEKIEKQEIKICCIIDSDYPVALKNIYSPPVLIYYKGKLPTQQCIAVVGSRKTTSEGRKNALAISNALAEKGYCIISGLARGIDSCAHHGALEKGKTAAILGNGINVCYPAENRNLMNRIIESGCVISEFPPDRKPTKYSFPARNRIISGLSEAVIVVEASLNSGALITADFALDQGREVFVFKNSPTEYSGGTMELLNEGAIEIRDIYDFLATLA